MKLQVMSDLHLEMHADRGAEFIRHLDPIAVDVLLLAGDITMARHYEDLENVFKLLARKYRHILYVPGNHEYYKSSPKQVARNLARVAKDIPEVVIPDNRAVVIAGQRFIGGTMWFRPDPMGDLNKRFMNDFSLIDDFEPWVYEQNAAFEKALATQLEAGDVVLTRSGLEKRTSTRLLSLRREGGCAPVSGSDAVGQRGAGGESCLRNLRLHVGERRRIEDTRDRIAHLLHYLAGAAGRLVDTLLALHECALAGTGERRQRPVDDSNDLSNSDLLRRPGEGIAAALTFLLLSIPAFFSSSRIASRNLRGIFSRSARSAIRTGPRASSAGSA